MSAITDVLFRRGALTAHQLYAEVADEFGSPRSFRRALSGTPDLLRFGPTTHRAFALRRSEMPPVPLYLCNEKGVTRQLGSLVALQSGQWSLVTEDSPNTWMSLGHITDIPGTVFQGLPWFLEAFRPAGFLGRAWVRENAAKHGWPQNVEAWTDDQVVTAALEEPWDWRGNLSIGPFVDVPNHLVPAATRHEIYAKRAEQVMQGVVVGASADGEQPKFTAVVDEGDWRRPVIVKFSQRITNNPAARRWADVMITEAMAARILTLHGMSAASTQVWLHDDRVWLETTRFDRMGADGRRGMASLRALAQTFNYRGPQSGWVEAVRYLHNRGALAAEEVAKTEQLATISHLLSNNDMHMGNLSFLLPSDDRNSQLTLAPVYDMTPMRWIPSVTTGVVPPLDGMEPLYRTNDMEALRIASEVWVESSCHELVSEEWGHWAALRAVQIRQVLESQQSHKYV